MVQIINQLHFRFEDERQRHSRVRFRISRARFKAGARLEIAISAIEIKWKPHTQRKLMKKNVENENIR